MTTLGIIGAMQVEVDLLLKAMDRKYGKTIAGSVFYEGTLEGLPVVVVQCGVGKVNAAICAQILCDCYHVTHLVNTGIAGSLCAELDIGASGCPLPLQVLVEPCKQDIQLSST